MSPWAGVAEAPFLDDGVIPRGQGCVVLIRHDFMNQKLLTAVLLFGLSAGADRSRGALDPPLDQLVALNEGLVLYQAKGEENFRAAIEIFSRVLEQNPREPTALLFRALCYGEWGLEQRKTRSGLQVRIGNREEILTMRGDAGRVEAMERESEALRVNAGVEGLSAPEQAVLIESSEDLEATLKVWREWSALSLEDLKRELGADRAKLQTMFQKEREQFRLMLVDVDALIAELTEPDAVVRLVNVIARSKVARMDEERALLQIQLASGGATDGDQESVEALRRSAAESLQQAADILESQLRMGFSHPGSEDAVRTRFFLGVIRFRQALPRRATTEKADADWDRLADSERMMEELVNDSSVPQRWRSYAALYLGLMLPVRAGEQADASARQALYDEALGRLAEAVELDFPIGESGSRESESSMAIPDIVARQRVQIAKQRTAAAEIQKRNDISLTLSAGFHRDTNVILLGDRTDLPRGISDPEDFGFPAAVLLDYTLDLSDRWALGVQARTTQLWHAEIDEFDEQRYGASVALQYRLMAREEDFGPVYLGLQYDYDYTLLGRSAFLENQTITPNIRIYSMDTRARTDVYAQIALRDYREPLSDRRFDRDGTYISLGLVRSYEWISMTDWYKERDIEPWGFADDEALWQEDPDIERRYLTPFVGAEYEWDSTYGDEFDQKEYTLRTGLLLPLPYGVDLDAAMEFQWQDYQHGSRVDFHRRARHDFVQEYALGLSRVFVLRPGKAENRFTPLMDRVLMTIRARVTWADDDSNVVNRPGEAVFSYDRAVYGISMAFSFN